MPVITENATPTVDPRITTYLQKHPLKIVRFSPRSSPVDPRIASYIANHPLQKRVSLPQPDLLKQKPMEPAVSSVRDHPLFRTNRRPNLFVKTPDYFDWLKKAHPVLKVPLAPTALPKPQEPTRPAIQTVVPQPPPVDTAPALPTAKKEPGTPKRVINLFNELEKTYQPPRGESETARHARLARREQLPFEISRALKLKKDESAQMLVAEHEKVKRLSTPHNSIVYDLRYHNDFDRVGGVALLERFFNQAPKDLKEAFTFYKTAKEAYQATTSDSPSFPAVAQAYEQTYERFLETVDKRIGRDRQMEVRLSKTSWEDQNNLTSLLRTVPTPLTETLVEAFRKADASQIAYLRLVNKIAANEARLMETLKRKSGLQIILGENGKPPRLIDPNATTSLPEQPPPTEPEAAIEVTPKETPQSPLPFHEGQPVRVRLTHASGTVVGVGPNNSIFIQNSNGEIITVEANDLDPIQLLTTDVPTSTSQPTKPVLPLPNTPFPSAPIKQPPVEKPLLPKPPSEIQHHVFVRIIVGTTQLREALGVAGKIEKLTGKGTTKAIRYEEGVLTVDVATDLSSDAFKDILSQEHITNIPIEVLDKLPPEQKPSENRPPITNGAVSSILKNPGGLPPIVIPTKETESAFMFEAGASTLNQPDNSLLQNEIYFFDEANGTVVLLSGNRPLADGSSTQHLALKQLQDALGDIQKAPSFQTVEKEIRDALHAISKEIQARFEDGGTTATVIQVVKDAHGARRAIIANCGNNRVWLKKNRGSASLLVRGQDIIQLFELMSGVSKDNGRLPPSLFEQVRKELDEARDLNGLSQEAKLLRNDLRTNQPTYLGMKDGVAIEIKTVPLNTGDVLLASTPNVFFNLTASEILLLLQKLDSPKQITQGLTQSAYAVSRSATFRSKGGPLTTLALKIL